MQSLACERHAVAPADQPEADVLAAVDVGRHNAPAPPELLVAAHDGIAGGVPVQGLDRERAVAEAPDHRALHLERHLPPAVAHGEGAVGARGAGLGESRGREGSGEQKEWDQETSHFACEVSSIAVSRA